MIDLHSHILFGLDDGARSIEDSINIARKAVRDEIFQMVVTPHFFRGNFIHDNFRRVEERREQLAQVLEEKKIPLDIFPGAEVHISHNLISKIRQNREYLVLNHSSYMLVEFPSDHIFAGVKNLFYELLSERITPIIAHPERNSVFVRHPQVLYDLVVMGSLVQSNAGSLTGIYGKGVQDAVRMFLNLKMVHFIGTDAHNITTVPPLLSEAFHRAAEIIGLEDAKALVEDNPKAVIENKDIVNFPEPVVPERKGKKLKIRFPSFFKNWK